MQIGEPVAQKGNEKTDPCDQCKVTFITPGGDPVNAANSTQGADGQNEFTYSDAKVGVLTIKLKAKVSPAECAAKIQKRAKFQVAAVGDSKLTWDAANPSGLPTVQGDILEATVQFTGLPSKNSAFGRKKAELRIDDRVYSAAEYEVFFPRDATNHPGTGSGVTPNWFFYWSQLTKYKNLEYAGNAGSQGGAAKAMVEWNYLTPRDKTKVHIYDGARLAGQSYGVGKYMSGIDRFMTVVVHENHHLDQIRRADPLVPSQRCWRYGWSWNQQVHNHWKAGNSGLWGLKKLSIDQLPLTPPFTDGPGQGADIDLTHLIYDDWPKAWPLPTTHDPVATHLHPIEGDAVEHADNETDEGDFADKDWGDPGKNHNTLLKYDD